MPGIPILQSKWKMAARVVPILFLVAVAKIAINYFGCELLTLNTIFTALISANIFLIGFNIAGVLADFKAGEKLPGELASHIEAIADECVYAYRNNGNQDAKNGFLYCVDFNSAILGWLYKKVKTKTILDKIAGFTDIFFGFQALSKTSFISRLKHEQSEIRKAVMRIHALREVRFSEAAYGIAEIMTYAIIAGMIFLRIEPFYEAMFYTVFVAFVFTYMLFLIRDLDDPFAYYDKKHSVEEISLHSLEALSERLEDRRKQFD